MRKLFLLLFGAAALLLSLYFLAPVSTSREHEKEEEEYESLEDRFAQEFEQLRDPATGEVPTERLVAANEYTREQQRRAANNRVAGFNWQERGPVYDVVGPSNNNGRGSAGNYTAGVVQTALVDLASDPTGNVVLVGSPSGGLWRCTNFLSSDAPNWAPVNDFMANLAIASICQDPSSPNIMYIATGDGNSRTVRGYGVWKSTNYGITWSLLPGTTTFNTAFKILCDNSGNVYLATGGNGLRRSNDGGATWNLISPSGLTATNPSQVTDIELSSTGRLHASFGYQGTRAQHAYTDNPATTGSGGWIFSSGIRRSTTSCTRIEMAVQGNVLYAITGNSSFNIDSCYKSIDGGQSWTLQNSAAYPTGLGSGQSWFAITLAINPDNPNEFIAGGLDAYRSSNEGLSVQRITYWVNNNPYVHADHHFMKWMKMGSESRILIGNDGGIAYSSDGGATWKDRNQNLGIKQFYSCAIHPTAGTNFLFAGSQDNGCHQLKNPGLSWSTETTGGDGAFVHINQLDPQIQFGSYIYNQFRRSVNGGNTWSPVNFSNSQGYFINPFDYDDAKNTLYSSNAVSSAANNQFRRWDNANTTGTSGSVVFNVDDLIRNGLNSNVSALKVSPHTADRLYLGSNSGKIVRIENASTLTSSADVTANATDLTGSQFPTGSINCINTGTSDNTLVAVFTNFGINNVWYSNNGGVTWTAIDGITGAGGLPDMPVWWAVFEPGSNTKLILGTEAGIYTTDAVNGSNTVWTPDPNFPIVRTRMLKIRTSDNTLVAATYGRGLFTTTIGGACKTPTINIQPTTVTTCAGSNAIFTVNVTGTDLTYQWRKNGTNISGATGSSYLVSNVTAATAGNYDVVITSACGNATSSIAALIVNAPTTITTQPTAQNVCAGSPATLSVTANGNGTLNYQWQKDGVNILGATAATYSITSAGLSDAGNYTVAVTSGCGTLTSTTATLTVNTSAGCVTAIPNVDPDVNGITLMPNVISNSTVLRVRVQRAMKVTWLVTDAQGKRVMQFSQKLTSGQTDLPLQFGHLTAGSYYLSGTTEKGSMGTLRFQKR